jgi:hypothetical protein
MPEPEGIAPQNDKPANTFTAGYDAVPESFRSCRVRMCPKDYRNCPIV